VARQPVAVDAQLLVEYLRPAICVSVFIVAIVSYLFYLFIMKFVQLGTQIKTQCKKKKIYKNTQKVLYEVHKNHIIKSTSDSQNSEI